MEHRQPGQLHIPTLTLTSVTVQVATAEATGQRMIVLGPVMLAVPLDAEPARQIAQALSGGIVIAPTMAIPNTQGH